MTPFCLTISGDQMGLKQPFILDEVSRRFYVVILFIKYDPEDINRLSKKS